MMDRQYNGCQKNKYIKTNNGKQYYTENLSLSDTNSIKNCREGGASQA